MFPSLEDDIFNEIWFNLFYAILIRIESMFDESKVMNFKIGTVLIQENTLSRKMFIIVKGKARVYKNYLGKKITLATLGPGELFGELSFFDAAPRSASVEVTKDMKAIIVDGKNSADMASELPEWLTCLLKTTFKRFRQLDHQLMIFQSISDFQKNAMKIDITAKVIYQELVRYNKMLKTVCSKIEIESEHKNKEVECARYHELHETMYELIGQKFLNLKIYFNKLEEFHFITNMSKQERGLVQINLGELDAFTKYLETKLETGGYMLLSYKGMMLIKNMIGHNFIDMETPVDEKIEVSIARNIFSSKNEFEKALDELLKYSIVEQVDDKFVSNGDELHQHYVYQSIIRSFDHGRVEAS